MRKIVSRKIVSQKIKEEIKTRDCFAVWILTKLHKPPSLSRPPRVYASLELTPLLKADEIEHALGSNYKKIR